MKLNNIFKTLLLIGLISSCGGKGNTSVDSFESLSEEASVEPSNEPSEDPSEEVSLEPSEEIVHVTSVSLDKESLSLNVGEQTTIIASILPENASDKSLTWSSSNEEIASVNNGTINALKSGHAVITVRSNDGGKQATCEISVNQEGIELISGSVKGIASKQINRLADGTYQLEKYDENDYVYAYYPGYKGRKWVIEVTVSNVVNNVDPTEYKNDGFWSTPVGAAGINDLGVNSFGALSYCGAAGCDNFNAFDNVLFLKDGNRSGVTGRYCNFARNLGGTGIESMADFTNGFKVTIVRDQNIFFYLINDVYIGYNNKWVGDGMWDDDYPGISSYKSGATFSNINVYVGDDFNEYTSNFYANYDAAQAIFPTYYGDDYILASSDHTNETGDCQYYNITKDGGLFLTNNAEQHVVRANYSGTKFYFEFSVDIKSMAKWVYDGDFSWVGIGAGHVGDYGGEHRAMAPVPVINQSKSSNRTDVNHSLNYIATPVSWTWEKLPIDEELANSIGTKYKCAVLRDHELVYYFVNDVLVKVDGNTWNMDNNVNNPTTPMIYNAWGGSAKISNVTLLKNSAEIDAKLRVLKGLPESGKVEPFSEAKVIIVAGQSNAEGYTPYSDLTSSERKLYNPYSLNVQIYYDAIGGQNEHPNMFNYVEFGQGANKANMGPEVGLAYELAKQNPDTNYYIVKVALGGSNLFNQWLSRSNGAQGPLYTQLMSDLEEVENYFRINEVSFSYAGFCWMQGEADACAKNSADLYYQNLKGLYRDIEADLKGRIAPEGLRFADAAIKGYDSTWQYHSIVNNAKSELCDEYDNYYFIDTNAMGLRTRASDSAHYDGLSCIRLGIAFADAILDL